LVNVTIKDPKKMVHNFSLTKLLKETERMWRLYDIVTFMITTLVLDANGNVTNELENEDTGNPIARNLFTDYHHISIKEVAESCHFYNEYTMKASQLASDNSLSLAYFKGNVEKELYNRAYDKMMEYDSVSHGGPLFLIILLSMLTTSDEATKTHIAEIFKNYSIKSSSVGEDVTSVVDLLQSLSNTLYSLKGNSFPDKFIDMVATIFTTTSVPDFNDMFEAVKKSISSV
jgi:hypothetical protein